MTKHEVLKKIWSEMPEGSKNRAVEITGYKNQTIQQILKIGRKDESILDSVIQACKQASKDVASEMYKQNKRVQEIEVNDPKTL